MKVFAKWTQKITWSPFVALGTFIWLEMSSEDTQTWFELYCTLCSVKQEKGPNCLKKREFWNQGTYYLMYNWILSGGCFLSFYTKINFNPPKTHFKILKRNIGEKNNIFFFFSSKFQKIRRIITDSIVETIAQTDTRKNRYFSWYWFELSFSLWKRILFYGFFEILKKKCKKF